MKSDLVKKDPIFNHLNSLYMNSQRLIIFRKREYDINKKILRIKISSIICIKQGIKLTK